ncbi:MAG: DNA polymerase III subunit gamma/tau [Cyanobacteria bacterium P01_G01_bin.54]
MAYEPLHHKYRPQTFAQLVGQEAIAQTLSNALTSGRIAPAYLFTGPRGTGKTSSSRILAKSLNCLSSETPTPEPCGECQVCQEITQGRAIDIVEIDAASNTGVDNIREIIERAQFAPVQCRYKVYVIDECHMLSTAAFNALLKTLEEPPDRVVFVLATTDPQRVLNTIISRCQRFDFRRIPLVAMVQHLDQIAQNEAIAINPDALTLVAQIANGGLRDAESLLDQLSLMEAEIVPETVWDLVGAVPEQDLLTLIQAIHSDNPEAAIAQCRSMLDRGREPMIVLQNLASFYLNLLIAKTAPQRNDLVAVTAPTWEQLCQVAPNWQLAEILQGQQKLKDSESQLRNTTQPRLWLEVTLLGLLPSALAIGSTPDRPAPQRSNVKSSPQPNLPPKPSAPPPATARLTPVQPPTQKPTQPPTPQPATPQPPVAPPTAQPTVETQPQTPTSPPPQTAQPTAETFAAREAQQQQESWQKVLNAMKPFVRSFIEQYCTLVALDVEDCLGTISVASRGRLSFVKGKATEIKVAFETVFMQPFEINFVVQDAKAKAASAAPQHSSTTPLPSAPAPKPPPFGDTAQPKPPPFGETQPASKPPASKTPPPWDRPAAPPPEPQPEPPTQPTISEAPARFVVEPPTPQPEPPSAPLPEPGVAESDATEPPETNGVEPGAAEENGQPSTVQSTKLQQIVTEFAEDFGEVIQFRAQE